jgi:F0F1-type ATP synthase membrane subunit a
MEFFPTANAAGNSDGSHAGPHILTLHGDTVTTLAGWEITNTAISMGIVMIVIFILALVIRLALSKKGSIVRAFGKDAVRRLDTYFTSLVGDQEVARRFLPITGGFFVFIFVANIIGLVIDYVGLFAPSVHYVLRPVNSDLSTTLILALAIVFLCQVMSVRSKGILSHIGHYAFNFHGDNLVEKIINVPIGWIHAISESARIASLSVRLFCNIFAGAALISIIAYLGSSLPGFL